MELLISEPSKIAHFITIFRNLKNLVSMVNISFSEKGFYIQGMDQNHICFLEIFIKSSWFDKFTTKDNVLGINTEILFAAINNWKEGYSITLEYDDGDELIITYKGEKLLTKQYELQLIDLDIDNINVPDTEYDLDLVLDSSVFKDVITELVQFDRNIAVSCSLEKINMKASGDMGKVNIEIQENDIIEYAAALETSETITINYGGDSILHGCNFHKLNKNVNVHISKDMPIKINYEMEHCKESYVRLYVAPKMDD